MLGKCVVELINGKTARWQQGNCTFMINPGWLYKCMNEKKVYTVMVNNSTNINKTKESVHSDGQ